VNFHSFFIIYLWNNSLQVMVERVYSEEEKKEIEEQQRVEEEKKAAAKGDNKRERALQDMMGGVLEVKKEDILKQVT